MATCRDGVWGPFDLGYVAHSLAVSDEAGPLLRVACSSFKPEGQNFVDVFSVDLERIEAVKSPTRLPHYFPSTRVRWFPGSGATPEAQRLATSGDYLRVWSASGELLQLLRHKDNPDGVCTPITSLDTSTGNDGCTLVSCDVYGVCCLWDAETGTLVKAIELERPLCDVAFGPDRLIAASGLRGECYFIDPRQPQEQAMSRAAQVRGPSRIAWSPHRPGSLAVAWQGKDGGLAIHDCSQPSSMLPPPAVDAVKGGEGSKGSSPKELPPPKLHQSQVPYADLQWSPAFPELLCCSKEDGVVEVWRVPPDAASREASTDQAAEICSRWEPRLGEVCTALGLTREVQPSQHYLVLATMPKQVSQASRGAGGSLWIAGLPAPNTGVF